MGHNLIDIDPCSKAPPLPTHHVQTHIANQPRQICQRILQFCEWNSKSEDSQIHFLRQVSPADFAPHHAPHDIRDRRLHVRQSPGERVARGSGLGAGARGSGRLSTCEILLLGVRIRQHD